MLYRSSIGAVSSQLRKKQAYLYTSKLYQTKSRENTRPNSLSNRRDNSLDLTQMRKREGEDVFPLTRRFMNTNQGIDVGNCCLTWDDTWRNIQMNGYKLKLSPTQYRIFRSFLSAVVPSKESEGIIIVAHRSYRDLQKEQVMSHRLLIKHISDLNARIMVMGLQLCAFQTGYILTLSLSVAQNV